MMTHMMSYAVTALPTISVEEALLLHNYIQ